MKRDSPRRANILIKTHVLEFHGQVVDAPYGRSDPVRKFPRFDYPSHQRSDELVVMVRRKPTGRLAFPILLGKKASIRADAVACKASNLAVKSHVRKRHPEWVPESFWNPVPAVHTGLNFARIVVAQPRIQGRERGYLPVDYRAIFDFLNGVKIGPERVIVG